MPRADEPTRDERALRVISIIGGSLAAASLTLAISYPFAQGLMFTIPLVMATTARLAGRRPLEMVALVVGVVMFASYALGIAPIVFGMLVVGPVVVIYLVTELLGSLDRVARTVWTVASVLALVGGFLGLQVSPNTAAGIALPCAVFGFMFAIMRLRRIRDAKA